MYRPRGAYRAKWDLAHRSHRDYTRQAGQSAVTEGLAEHREQWLEDDWCDESYESDDAGLTPNPNCCSFSHKYPVVYWHEADATYGPTQTGWALMWVAGDDLTMPEWVNVTHCPHCGHKLCPECRCAYSDSHYKG